MKVIIALIIVCVAFVAVAAIDIHQIEEKIIAANKTCMDNPAVAVSMDEMFAFKITHEKGPRPANLGKLAMCILREAGWMRADNTFDTTELKQMLERRNENAAELQRIIEKCTSDRGSPEETAINMLGCVTIHR